MPTTALITVTYGHRAAYVVKMAEVAQQMGISALVVVDNGSAAESYRSLLKLSARYQAGSMPVHIIRHERNLGSASGFHAGLSFAMQQPWDYFLLLDDDNLPSNKTLEALHAFHATLSSTDAPVALQCMRKPGMTSVHEVVMLQPANNFLGFHLGKLWNKVVERLAPAKRVSSAKRETKESPIQVSAGPYGGLFLARYCVEKIGLPDKEFVLYMDDFEYTNRIVKQQGQLWLVPQAEVYDVELSYHMEQTRKPMLYHSILDAKHDFRVYYSTRNTIYFYQKVVPVTNSFIYLLNRWAFLTFIHLAALIRGKADRLNLMKRAIQDAKSGRMGEGMPLP